MQRAQIEVEGREQKETKAVSCVMFLLSNSCKPMVSYQIHKGEDDGLADRFLGLKLLEHGDAVALKKKGQDHA